MSQRPFAATLARLHVVSYAFMLAACSGGTDTPAVASSEAAGDALDPAEALRTALLDATPGEVVEVPAGTLSFDRSLSLSVDGVTLRGAGSGVSVLDFSGQRAGAEVNPGTSRIDYIRPSGAGGDSLLLNFGQSGRRSRAWWRTTLDQFGAADALVAIARLDAA